MNTLLLLQTILIFFTLVWAAKYGLEMSKYEIVRREI